VTSRILIIDYGSQFTQLIAALLELDSREVQFLTLSAAEWKY
jgi:GMP synthase-like glutamine amidotransferase